MTDQTKTADGQELELLSFHVGEQEYSVDIMSVREIRGWTKTTPLPHSPSYVKGVINLRGTVLPIVDLADRLGLDAGADDGRKVIIVVCIADHTVGLLVNAVSDILAIPRDEIQAPPEMAADSDRTFISALTIQDGRMIRILDLAAVLPHAKGIAA